MINTGKGLMNTEGADPRSDRNFSFDTEKDPAAVSGRNKIDGSGETAQAKAPASKASGLAPFTEAPADFDNKTNGVVPQQDFNDAKEDFEEVEEILPDPKTGGADLGLCTMRNPVALVTRTL